MWWWGEQAFPNFSSWSHASVRITLPPPAPASDPPHIHSGLQTKAWRPSFTTQRCVTSRKSLRLSEPQFPQCVVPLDLAKSYAVWPHSGSRCGLRTLETTSLQTSSFLKLEPPPPLASFACSGLLSCDRVQGRWRLGWSGPNISKVTKRPGQSTGRQGKGCCLVWRGYQG